MKNGKKTTHRNHSSFERDELWFIHKWFLIGAAVHLCYRCLHFSPLIFHIVELVLCTFIIIGFGTIIAHHATAKKAADYPDQLIFPSPLAVIGGGLSWVIHIGFVSYGIYQFTFASEEFRTMEQIFLKLVFIPIIALIIYLMIPNFVKSIIYPFSYLNEK